jgi:hypothetical protein
MYLAVDPRVISCGLRRWGKIGYTIRYDMGASIICSFSFGHCVVCSSSIYGIWLPLWYLQTLLVRYVFPNLDTFESCDEIGYKDRRMYLAVDPRVISCGLRRWGKIGYTIRYWRWGTHWHRTTKKRLKISIWSNQKL